MKYKKDNTVVEAFKWAGGPVGQGDPEWAADALKADVIRVIHAGKAHAKLIVVTANGSQLASPGDYIVRGGQGELFMCRPDAFEKDYEAVQ